MGVGRILLLFVGTAASVGGATVLWVSSLSPRDVPFVAPVHPRLVQHEEPVVATPLPVPHIAVKKKVKRVLHPVVAKPVTVPAPTPVVVPPVTTSPPPVRPKPAPPPAPAPAPSPTPVPAPPTATPPAAPTTTTVASPPPPPETTPTPTPPPPDNSKPGNGYGDPNHVHTGPPGQVKKDN